MFPFNRCTVPGCQDFTVSGSEKCYTHVESSEECKSRIIDYIRENNRIFNLNCNGITFEDIDISGKRFYACSFSHTKHLGNNLEDTAFKLCFFDFSDFSSCNFTHTYMISCVFAGSSVTDTIFQNSDILHSNFNGINGRRLNFDDSDLYFSSFIRADLEEVTFIDCNLKKCNFSDAQLADVDFKYSNFEEAEFDEYEEPKEGYDIL
jgi:uncharacterized protein YjbI with pentapeptide repeats